MKSKYIYGVALCLMATLSWGGMFPVMTSALREIDPFTFTAVRYSLAAIPFVVLLILKEGVSALSLTGERYGLAWVLGSAGFAGFGFLAFLGQKLAGPSGALTASIVTATMPLLALLVGWVLKGNRPPPITLLLILMSFSGVTLVITKGDVAGLMAPDNYGAYIPLILGALSWVIYTIGASYFPTWSPYRYTAITTLLGLTTVIFVNASLICTDYVPLPSAATLNSVLPHLVYMSLVAGFIGVLSWNIGNRIITPMNGVLFMDVVPITAFAVSSLTGIQPTSGQMLGAAITASSLILNNIYQRYRTASSRSRLASA